MWSELDRTPSLLVGTAPSAGPRPLPALLAVCRHNEDHGHEAGAQASLIAASSGESLLGHLPPCPSL